MANQLKMAIAHAILGLLAKGCSRRKIARELGVHRETVGRYADKRAADGLTAPPAAEPEAAPKPATH